MTSAAAAAQWAFGPILVPCVLTDSLLVHRCPQSQSASVRWRAARGSSVVPWRAVIGGMLAGIVLGGAQLASAQELVPRAYVIAPTGANALDAGYAHLAGGLQFDGAVPITGAQANTSVLALGYYHS